eukprot:3698397-Pyramimonas_sp.AAC.1
MGCAARAWRVFECVERQDHRDYFEIVFWGSLWRSLRADAIGWVEGLRSGDLRGMAWVPTCDHALRRLLAPATSKAMCRADMLVRGFLRHVMGSEARVVLAGSAGAAILMNKLGAQRD